MRLPLKRTNTGVTGLDADRLDELRERYEEIRANRSAPRLLRSYARAALAEIRIAAKRRGWVAA